MALAIVLSRPKMCLKSKKEKRRGLRLRARLVYLRCSRAQANYAVGHLQLGSELM